MDGVWLFGRLHVEWASFATDGQCLSGLCPSYVVVLTNVFIDIVHK